MIDLKLLLFAQYPALMLLSLFFLISYMLVRKDSAVKSVLWVLLFGVSLAASVVFLFLGMQQGYWSLKTLFPIPFVSWIGIVLTIVLFVVHFVHTIEKKHNKRVLEKELQRAEQDKAQAVAQAQAEARAAAQQAHEEGRIAAHQEAEEARYSQAAEEAGAAAAASDLAREVSAPIELQLDASPASPAAPAFDPMTGQPLGMVAPAAFDPMTGQPLAAGEAPAFDPMTGQPLGNTPEA